MRKFSRLETQLLKGIGDDSDNNAEAITPLIEILIQERDAGANSQTEMDRIDDLIAVRNRLTAISILIDNASGEPI